jgi:hypothetical protein
MVLRSTPKRVAISSCREFGCSAAYLQISLRSMLKSRCFRDFARAWEMGLVNCVAGAEKWVGEGKGEEPPWNGEALEEMDVSEDEALRAGEAERRDEEVSDGVGVFDCCCCVWMEGSRDEDAVADLIVGLDTLISEVDPTVCCSAARCLRVKTRMGPVRASF